MKGLGSCIQSLHLVSTTHGYCTILVTVSAPKYYFGSQSKDDDAVALLQKEFCRRDVVSNRDFSVTLDDFVMYEHSS